MMGHIQDWRRADDYDRLLPPEGIHQEYADGERVICEGTDPGTVLEMNEQGKYLVERDVAEYGQHRFWYQERDLAPYYEDEEGPALAPAGFGELKR